MRNNAYLSEAYKHSAMEVIMMLRLNYYRICSIADFLYMYQKAITRGVTEVVALESEGSKP